MTSFNLAYIQDLVDEEKYLLESRAVKPVVVPKVLTLQMIIEFLPQFDPAETYLRFIPSFLEEVDREYLLHVINTIYTIGDEGTPLMVFIVAEHQRNIRFLISRRVPKSTLNQSFSTTLFQKILQDIITGANEAERNENQNRMEVLPPQP